MLWELWELYIASTSQQTNLSRNQSRSMACSKGCASNHCKHLVHTCTVMKDFGGALPRLGTQPCPASCFGCPGYLAVELAALLAQDLWATFEQAGQLLDSSRAGCGCPYVGLRLGLGTIREHTSFAVEAAPGTTDDVGYAEAKLVQARPARSRCTEDIDADKRISPLAPAHCHRSLHTHLGHALRQKRFLVALRLQAEELPAWHGHHTHRTAHLLGSIDTEVHLGASGNQDELGVRTLDHRIGTLHHVLNRRIWEVGQRLPGKCQEGGHGLELRPLHRHLVGTGCLVAVRWPHHIKVRNHAQRGNCLNGLVSRAVLAQSNGVVRCNKDGAALGQCDQADGVPHVVTEDSEGGAVGHQA